MDRRLIIVGAAAALLGGCRHSDYGSSNYSNDRSYYEPMPGSGSTGSGSQSSGGQSDNGQYQTQSHNGQQRSGNSQLNNGGSQGSVDSDFMKEANTSNLKEIELARLAIQRAANPSVRDFGQKLVNDHQQLGNQLSQIAQDKNVDLNKQLQQQGQSDIGQFSQLNGSEFDQQFIQKMVSDHQQAISTFEQEARSGNDPAVRSFAARALPELREHLRMAKDLQQNMTAPKLGQPNRNNSGNMNNPGGEPNQNPDQQNPGEQQNPNSPGSPSMPPR